MQFLNLRTDSDNMPSGTDVLAKLAENKREEERESDRKGIEWVIE